MFSESVVTLPSKDRVELNRTNTCLQLLCLSSFFAAHSPEIPFHPVEIERSSPMQLSDAQISLIRNSGSYEVDFETSPGPESFVPFETRAVKYFNNWLLQQPGRAFENVVTQVWQATSQQLGSYDILTSEFLIQRRQWRAQIKEYSDKLERDFPTEVTHAAYFLSKQHVFEFTTLPIFQLPDPVFEVGYLRSSFNSYDFQDPIGAVTRRNKQTPENSLTQRQSEEVLHNWLQQNNFFSRTEIVFSPDYEKLALDYLESRARLAVEMQKVKKDLYETRFPAIPMETTPSDISRIPYNKSLCRFSAPLACTLFNLAQEPALMVRVSVRDQFIAEEHVLVYLPRQEQFYESTASSAQDVLRQASHVDIEPDGTTKIRFGETREYWVSHVGYPSNYSTNAPRFLSPWEVFKPLKENLSALTVK